MDAPEAPVPRTGDPIPTATRPPGGRNLRALAADPVYRFATFVIALGVATLGVLLVLDRFDPVERHPWQIVLLTLLAAASEAISLKSPRQHDDTRVSPSNLIGFSALLIYGSSAGVIVFAGGLLIWGLVTRGKAIKVAFNTAQFVLAAGAAGAVLNALSDVPHHGMPIHAGDLPAIVAAGLVLVCMNDLSTAIVSAMAMGVPVRAHVRRNLALIVIVDLILIGFTPVVVVALDFSFATLPLLTLPLAAVYYATRQADKRGYESTHDALTGLANRTLFLARADQELERARHTGEGVGVLALDLDNFKDFNDTLGHAEADVLLQSVAERLRSVAGPDDLVARLGSDDFGILVVGAPGAAEMRGLAVCIRAALDEPFVIAGLRLGVSASVGIACSRDHGSEAESLVRRAAVAMQRAKVQRTGVELYDAASDPYSSERLVLAAELREGISRGELVLHYQPKLAVESGEVVGVEALVRWRHPQRGLIPPNEFIELAERTDVIGALTMNMLRMALSQVASWRHVEIRLPVAVNLPAQMLLDRDLPGDIASLLARYGLGAESLELEITEGSLIHDPHRSAQILDELSGMGVRIAIDDFGTGYSSLAWLKRFPVNEIKVDRSFVTDLAADESDAAIVRSTINLGRSLDMTVVAEGVETAEVLERLAEYGCDVVQGYLISRPVPAAQLVTWLRARTSSPQAAEVRTKN